MKFDKIYIITDAPIPIGYAPTNRVLSYATGFKANNVNCEIIIIRKTDIKKNTKVVGFYYDIKFQYLFKETQKSIYFLKRRWDNFTALFKLFLFGIKNLNRKSVVIYYSSYTRYVLILKIVKSFNNFLMLKEESEHPSVYLKGKHFISKLFFPKIHFSLFDGILSMTTPLKKEVNKITREKPIVLIPMTVDINRFKRTISLKKNWITYVGHLDNKKDGILFLLEAFHKVRQSDTNNYKLNICGYTANHKDKELLFERIKSYGLSEDVLFNENVSNLEIPDILMSSKVLVLPRPKSKQAENGFPTKLGEYLASSVPVIVSKVGEIPDYLTHKKNAYLIEPDDINEIKKGLKYVLDNSNEAIRMGQKGREIALQYFNNIKQTKKIINFIKKF